ATGDRHGSVRLWDVGTQRQITNLSTQRIRGLSLRKRIAAYLNDDGPMGIDSVVFSPDGTTLAWGSFDGVVVWDVNRREAVTGFSPYPYGRASAAVFSPGGETLATLIYDGDVELWNISTRSKLAVLRWPLSTRSALDNGGHGVSPLAVSADGSTLANSKGDTVMLWDVEARQANGAIKGHSSMVRNLAFSPDGAMLATSSRDNTVKLWDVADRKEIATLRGHSPAVTSVAFSPDGATLARGGGGSGGRTAELWDVAAQRKIATLEGHASLVHSVAFSPDGATLATGSRDRTLKLWDVETRREIAAFPEHQSDVKYVAFAPNGRTLAIRIGGRDATVKLLDVATRQGIAVLGGRSDPIRSVAFSPDSNTLATCGGRPAMVKLWDAKTGLETASWQAGRRVTSVAFSLDGFTIATGTYSGVQLWDVQGNARASRRPGSFWEALRGRSRPTSEGHPTVVTSADGALTVRAGHPISLWDVHTLHTLAALQGDSRSVEAVTFSPDGAILARGGRAGTVLLFRVPNRK
ncbi:MAG: WD40 repeat domain-containing protein, partial [Candidatus Poribacteria bacterium]